MFVNAIQVLRLLERGFYHEAFAQGRRGGYADLPLAEAYVEAILSCFVR